MSRPDEYWHDGVPEDHSSLRDFIEGLLRTRLDMKDAHRGTKKRVGPSRAQRDRILAKTNGRCHLCGGAILSDQRWNADHVLAHGRGGNEDEANYLPAHGLCNNYRWDYLPEEFQLILKLGVWARETIKNDSGLGGSMSKAFLKKESVRIARRK
jgi:hypothetical protein